MYSWKRKIANPITQIDDFVKHIFREHNLKANYMANVGAEGQRSTNTERWKAVKGYWDGNSKKNGKSGCGVVVEGVNRGQLEPISTVAVLLSVGKATVAEVMGV